MSNYTLNIRPKRQATFPAELLAKVGVAVGDQLVAEVSDSKILLKPKKQVALDALKEIQRIIKESGVPEEELQRAAQKDREKWAQKYASS